jgi:hypothetical protein
MDLNVNKSLDKWLNEVEELTLPDYDRLPDIDLYMEQLLTYLERESNVLVKNSQDKQITSCMINNYVKGHIIKAPKAKKYNREQLSLLGELIYLKQVLSLPEIKQIFDVEYQDEEYKVEYNKYLSINNDSFDEAIKETKNSLKSCKENDFKDLTDLSLKLAAKANAYATVSKRILYLLNLLKHVNEQNEENKNKQLDLDSILDLEDK